MGDGRPRAALIIPAPCTPGGARAISGQRTSLRQVCTSSGGDSSNHARARLDGLLWPVCPAACARASIINGDAPSLAHASVGPRSARRRVRTYCSPSSWLHPHVCALTTVGRAHPRCPRDERQARVLQKKRPFQSARESLIFEPPFLFISSGLKMPIFLQCSPRASIPPPVS
jgi:hypothetical protein